jgi:hypothetical protein
MGDEDLEARAQRLSMLSGTAAGAWALRRDRRMRRPIARMQEYKHYYKQYDTYYYQC